MILSFVLIEAFKAIDLLHFFKTKRLLFLWSVD